MARVNEEKRLLLEWLRQEEHESPYLLIRTRLYDRFAPDLAGLVTPIHIERGLERNDLVLLRLQTLDAVARGGDAPTHTRR